MPKVSVRYFVNDVDSAAAFYQEQLGFEVDVKNAPAFAMLFRDDLRLLLSSPTGGGGAGRPMPDGRVPEPGGWNRMVLDVFDLDAEVARLRQAGASFRNEIVQGMAGRQILLEDPSGNPIELFEWA